MNFRNEYLKYKIKYLELKYGKKIPFALWPDIEFHKMSDYIRKYKIYKKKYLLLKKIKEQELECS